MESRHFIIRTLLADGIITQADVRRAQEHAASTGGDFLQALVQLGITTSRRLAIANARICEHPFVDLDAFDVDIANARLLPRVVADRFTVFPLFIVDGVATVAMIDPLNLPAIDQVRQLLRCDVDPVVADAEQLRALIARAYSLAPQAEGAVEGAGTEEVALTTGDEPAVAAVTQILAGGLDLGASDVHVNPEERELVLRYRVDGVLMRQQGPARLMHEAIVQRLKVMARLDLTQTRKPQDGKFRFRHRDAAVDVRLSVVPTVHGENVVMRLLRPAAQLGTLNDLGMPAQVASGFAEALVRPHGIILVTGPTGSGKTTTLYTALHKLNSPDVNIVTIEDPVEVRLPMVRQVQVNHDIGLTFASALRSFLRQDPDIILVGEVRDQDTAKIAVQAAMTGHLVFATLHTNDAVGAVTRLEDLEVPRYAVSDALLCSLAQRLVRKLCPDCAKPDDTNPAPSGWPPGAAGRKAPGSCAACRHTGYRGRLGVFELLRMTAGVRTLIDAGASHAAITAGARAEGMRSLFDDGVEKALRGLTSCDEVLALRTDLDRATVEGDAARAARRAA